MRPLEGNEEFCNNPSESGLKTAADLIMWTGPDIPCLDLCTGDTIQKVIYDLAIILCDITDNVLDVTKLDFKCMLDSGECPPDTLLETLQLIINQHCGLDIPDGSSPAGSLPIVNLPTCLHYKNTDGDTITSLRLDLYAKFLADTICKIIIDVKSLKSVVTNLTTQLNALNATITGGGGSAGGTGSITTVTSKCLSAPTPGQTINIATAFSNLELAMCSYIETLGTSEQWITLINNQCISNNDLIPGSTTEIYGSLPGWISDPNSVVQSMTNLWTVVCTLNDKTRDIASTGGTACFPAAPSIVYDTVAKLLTWTSPAPSTYAQPLGYKITVKNNTTNTVVHQNNTVSGLSYDLAPYLTDSTLTYKIELVAAYDCGDSTAGVTLAAPATSGGTGGGGTTTSAMKVKIEIAKGIDLYSNSGTINSPISQASPYSNGNFSCACSPSTDPKLDEFFSVYLTDNADVGITSTDICTIQPSSSFFFDGYLFGSDDVNAGTYTDLNPEVSTSGYYQFKATLVDSLTENNVQNTTGKPIVIKIRTKRAYWKLNGVGLSFVGASSQSPKGWQEYVINIVIPANAIYSNWVKVYYHRGTDEKRNCRKYNQCGFCYLGAYEGTTEVDSVVERPTNLGTVLSTVGILTSSFNTPVLSLPTSCAGIL